MGVSCCGKSNLNKNTEMIVDQKQNKDKQIKNKKKFKEIQQSIDIYYKDIYNQNNIIQNYISFTNKLNSDINDINNNLKLTINSQDNNNNEINNQNIDNAGNSFTDKLKNMLDKIYELKSIIEELKDNLFKKVENLYETIQNKFSQKSEINNDDVSIKENDIITDKLNELDEINKKLKENKEIYDNKKKDIENDIQDVQKKAKDFAKNAEILYSTLIEGLKINSDEIKINTKFFKNSMLFDIKEFENPFELFSTRILFKEDDNNDYQQIQNLLTKNWNEKCFVYDDYDLHDVNYELKAVGIPSNTFYSSASFAFYLDTSIEIIGFEIDGKKSNYTFDNYLLKFDTHLQNLDVKKIHIIYKESPIFNKLSPGEIKQRKYYRTNFYGIDSNIKGQTAKYTLIIKADFEVVSFKDQFFIKTNDKEYTWGGKVPPEGRRTIVSFSKSKVNFEFEMLTRIQSIYNKPLEKTELKIPFSFKGGNNEIIKFDYSCQQTDNIKEDKEKREYVINFIKIKENYGEFIIKGELRNRCSGEWICDLTDEEIESKIPDDFKYNKEKFKENAETIIKNYDMMHKNDAIEVTEFVKIGKWVNENIKYDIRYKGRENISATETFNNKAGVCHHLTKLYNALMYSLGFKCVYVSGYAMDKKVSFSNEEAHAWSLFKINGKWLPFDATWGLFSGKLPSSHIFKGYFSNKVEAVGTDSIQIQKTDTKGKYSEEN